MTHGSKPPDFGIIDMMRSVFAETKYPPGLVSAQAGPRTFVSARDYELAGLTAVQDVLRPEPR